MATRSPSRAAHAHDAALEAFAAGLHIHNGRAAFVLHRAGGHQHGLDARAGIKLRLGGHSQAQAAGVGELENRRHGARVGVDDAADGDQLAVPAGLDDEGLGETIDGKRSAARRSQPADLAFRHARFQPQPAGVGDMEQGRALGDEGAGRHRDIGQRASNRCADGDAARSPQLSLPRLRRIGLGFGHALVGAGFEQAPFSDGFVLEQRFHALAFAPRLLQPDARLAGGGLQRRLIGLATETRRQIRQHLTFLHRLADARKAARRPQHAGRRRGQQRLAIRLCLDRRRGGDRRPRRALDCFDRGEVDLPLLLLGEGDAAGVCMVAVVCGGSLGIRENLHRAELVRHAAVRRIDDQRQLALAAGLGCHVGFEDAGHGRGVGNESLFGRTAACQHDSEFALRHRLEVGEPGEMGDEGRGLADDEGRKLDIQFGLVAEVGELFAFRAVVGVAGGLCGGAVVVAAAGGFLLAAAGEQQGGDQCRQRNHVGGVHSGWFPVNWSSSMRTSRAFHSRSRAVSSASSEPL
jgi:hypothetical protein